MPYQRMTYPQLTMIRILLGLVFVNLLAAVPTSMATAQQNCSPAYPDVCIAPPPPDLDCPDLLHQNFRVLPPDPHRLDGDLDGIGCEAR
jgi:hypothetical protein